jgi:hypothetical protein
MSGTKARTVPRYAQGRDTSRLVSSVTTFSPQALPPRWRGWAEGRPFRPEGTEPFYGELPAARGRLLHAVTSDARTSYTTAGRRRADRVEAEAHEALQRLYDTGHMTRRDYSVRIAWALYRDEKVTPERTKAWEMQVEDVKKLNKLRATIERRMDRGLDVTAQKRSFFIQMMKCGYEYGLTPRADYPLYRGAPVLPVPRQRQRRPKAMRRVNELRCRLARRGMRAREIALIELMWLVPYTVEKKGRSLTAVPCSPVRAAPNEVRERFTALVDAIEKGIKGATNKRNPGEQSPARRARSAAKHNPSHRAP